tara:strand:+ start:1622 stop:1879 length:258 start_codon:yes stop_codon:yes gene_type:complete
MKTLDIFLGIAMSLLTFYVYADDVKPLELTPVIIEAEKEDAGCQQNPDGSAVGSLVGLFLGAYFVGFLVGKTDRDIKNREEEDVE